MAALNIPMKSIKLPKATIDSAIRLMGFDYGEHLFHLLAFDFGDDGGAIGIWREGSEFCARISLDALAEFWRSAQRGIDMTEPGRALHGTALEIIEALMNEDLPKDSPEGLAFNKLVTAVETYEKATLPPPFGNAGALPSPLPPGASAGAVPSDKKHLPAASEAVEVLRELVESTKDGFIQVDHASRLVGTTREFNAALDRARALVAASLPVSAPAGQEVRMLTLDEVRALWQSCQSYDGAWESIQRKFCEVNAGKRIPIDGQIGEQ